MPTFTAIALENLVEPTVRDSGSKSRPPKQETNKNDPKPGKKYPNIYISPALYTTPKATPIPETPASYSPSPYVVNHKRRQPRLPEAANRLDGFEIRPESEEGKINGDGGEGFMGEVCSESDGSCLKVEIVEDVDRCEVSNEGNPGEDEGGDFFCSHDSIDDSSGSVAEGGDSFHQSALKISPLTTQSEFYDAAEEFSSDGLQSLASQSFDSDVEAELRTARLNLFMEIERRKKAEESLNQLQNQWQRVARSLSQVGLSLPVNPDPGTILPDINSAEQCCQEVIIARFVSMSIGRGQARAEAEAAAETIINSKNQEIARLRDKVQYYEAVNHEMFQRNQEVIELSRKRRQRRRMRKKWIWSCIGLSVTLGASVLAYSYLPHVGKHLSPTSDASTDIHVSLPKSENARL